MERLPERFMIEEVHRGLECLEVLEENLSALVNRLHESVFCGGPIVEGDLKAAAADECRCNRLLQKSETPICQKHERFAGLERLHRQVHESGRAVLQRAQDGKAMDPALYHRFNSDVNAFRTAISTLSRELRQRLGALARLSVRIFDEAGEGVLIAAPDATIVAINQAFSEITGYSEAEALGNTPAILRSGCHDHLFYEQMWGSLCQSGRWQGEIWNRRKGGEVYPEWLSISAVRDNDGTLTYFVGIFSDISAVKRREQRLEQLAHYDSLTGLPNRGLFYDRLHDLLQLEGHHASTIAILFLDLDRFKAINDTLGHGVGDALLAEVAQRLREGVRRSDTAARLGGDEFVVILPGVSGAEGARRLARKLIAELTRPYAVGGQTLDIGLSVGISLYPLHGEDADELVRAADMAMYEAKRRGPNSLWVYSPDSDATVAKVFELEQGLHHALARGHFVLYYQPQFDVETRRILGMEALLRWQHPQRGLIGPERFLPVAEESGLIAQIGEWVLAEACRQNREWQRQGLPRLPVSVNISSHQLRQRNFAEQVVKCLDEAELDPQWLTLELTEAAILQDPGEALGLLRQLKSIGVGITIDQFGSGYTGLSYLKRFPVDSIKIDRSFVAGLCEGENDGAMMRAILAMGQTLGLKVVAEGVEAQEQLDRLLQYHYADVQGYLLSVPLPAEQAGRFLAGNARKAVGPAD